VTCAYYRTVTEVVKAAPGVLKFMPCTEPMTANARMNRQSGIVWLVPCMSNLGMHFCASEINSALE
jgi:hypothetical protein